MHLHAVNMSEILSDMEMDILLVSGIQILCLGSVDNQWKQQCNTPISSVCNKPVLKDS